MKTAILIPTIDNGKSKVTVFSFNDKVIEVKYNYGKGYGFKFLTKYSSLENYTNRLSTNGAELIYSTTNNNDCTTEGREIEFILSKI